MSTTEVLTLPFPTENNWPPSPDSLRLRRSSAAIQQGSLIVKPILQADDSSFGAEVSGVDWERPVPEDVVQQVCTRMSGRSDS